MDRDWDFRLLSKSLSLNAELSRYRQLLALGRGLQLRYRYLNLKAKQERIEGWKLAMGAQIQGEDVDEAPRISLLWVDDQIDLLQGHIQRLEAGGIAVTAAASCSEAILLIRSDTNYDGVMLDIRMPNGESGLSLLPEIQSHQEDAQPIVFSSFLHLGEERARLDTAQRQMGKTILQLEKGQIPHLFDDHFDRFFTLPIKNALEGEAAARLSMEDYRARAQVRSLRSGRVAAPLNQNPYDIDFDDFLSLPTTEKCKIISTARRVVERQLKQLFSKGFIWVAYCGDARAPVVVARTRDEILSEEKLLVEARRRGKAPFHFAADAEVDDISHRSDLCSKNGGTKGYPIIDIDLDGDSLFLHFDTGASESYLSCEYLIERGLMEAPKAPGSARINRKEVFYQTYYAEAIVKDQFRDVTYPVMLWANAIIDWNRGPLRRECFADCAQGVRPVDRLCVFRKGLLGRDLIQVNRLRVMISGTTGQTGFNRETDA